MKTCATCLLAATIVAGCAKPQEEDIPPAQVTTVEAYGLTLDESASPQQVTYVLLRSLADDVEHARAGRRQEQRQALETTFAVAAYTTIERRLLDVTNLARTTEASSFGAERDRRLFELVRNWAPIVAYYVRSFDAQRWPTFNAEVAAQMRLRPEQGAMRVLIDVAHDPDEPNPEKHETATLDVELRQETAGGNTYWRVARLSYVPKAPPRPATQPTAMSPVSRETRKDVEGRLTATPTACARPRAALWACG